MASAARFRRDDRGQDMIEYTLLLMFVAVFMVGMFASLGDEAHGVWNVASSEVAAASRSVS